MKIALLVAMPLLLAVSACSHKPVVPCDDLVAGCSAAEQGRPAKLAVRDAKHTVQLMVQRPTLINGEPAEPKDWPASVYASSNGGACSATLVGDRALFLAAHCMNNGAAISFSAGANRYTGRCTHYPGYRSGSWPGNTQDFALCFLDRPVTGVPFESFGFDVKLAAGDTVRLTGYGCIRPGGGGGNDGIFRIGEATVRGLPNGDNFDVVTIGGAALCYGDSGGAAYKEAGLLRYIFATNSRGNIEDESYLSSVFSDSFKNWVTSWAKTNSNVAICGLHPNAQFCRNDSIAPPTPPTDGKFELNTRAACVKGIVQPNYLPRKDEVIKSVKDALEKH